MNSFYNAHINRFSTKPEPEETDPKPVTAPWPGDDIKTPDDSDPDTKIPFIR